MNFLLHTYEGKAVARPDSTRNKDNGDIFIPEDINTVGFTPVLYVRMCRTGKAIGKEFAGRYYDAIGFGVLLYPTTDDGRDPHFCRATGAIHDKTSLLPLAMYNPITLEQGGNLFLLKKDGKEIFSCNTMGMTAKIAEALSACSAHTTIHKGDFTIVELDRISPLQRRNEGDCHLSASFCENETIDIELKF